MQLANPFPRVSCRYGAPMGRHGDSFDQLTDWPADVPLYAEHCGGDGYYDRGGAYWGHSGVCAVYSADGDVCAYVDAYSPAKAARMVREIAPDAVVHGVTRRGFFAQIEEVR